MDGRDIQRLDLLCLIEYFIVQIVLFGALIVTFLWSVDVFVIGDCLGDAVFSGTRATSVEIPGYDGRGMEAKGRSFV